MSDEEVNKYLTEELFGECWHHYWWWLDVAVNEHCYRCADCGIQKFQTMRPSNQNFFTPEGFFKLWNKAQEMGWWGPLVRPYMLGTPFGCYDKIFDLINPTRFAIEVYSFLSDREV